jgi:NAD(P)-dependent dehydrogenase (short-subunit alcohol dehydrogenase family)
MLVTRATEHFGPVEILVNNAATVFADSAQDESRAHIETTIGVNLVAPLRLCQLVHAGMAETGKGAIINVSSIVAHVGMGGRLPQASYAASKGGLAALTRELAAQWARDGIRVNAIAPGFFRSEITAEIFENEKIHEFILRNSLIRRVGEAADFDGALLFLASDASGFVTGQTLHVDGGWTAR